jgi:hypothetical protein
MSIDQHVSVTVTVNNAGIALEGFGTIGVLTYKTLWPERIRRYSRLADVIADGFDADSPEALAASTIFSQSPHPTEIAIIRGNLPPTQRYLVGVTDVDEFEYQINVEGEGVTSTTASYQSDDSATLAEIHNGLVSSLNAVVGNNYTAAFAPLVVADTTFVGEADDDTLTTAAALVVPDFTFTAAASDICTAVAHGLITGDGPFQLTTTAADLPLNLLTVTDYWVIRIDNDTFYFAESVADAIAGTQVDIADAGTGVHTVSDTAETRRLTAHGLLTGDGPVQVSNGGGALPTGLTAATDYWVIRTGASTLKFASSLALALAGTALPLSTDGTGVQTLADTASTVSPSSAFTITADAAGDWFSLEVLDTTMMSITQNHTDPGIATDLAAIELADSDWYYLYTFFNSEAMVLAAAAWVEGTSFKAYVVDVVDSASENVAASGGDVLDDLGLLGYKRTLPFYHRKPNEMFGAGVEGRLAPLPVGSWTAAYKTIAGATRDVFSSTQTTNLDAKRASYYKAEAGRSITWDGKVGNTDFGYLDVTVALDFVMDLIQKRVFGIFVALNKVAYTDEDIAVLAGAVEGAIDIAKSDRHKIVAPGTPGSDTDPPPTVTFPRVADIDSGTRALRELPDGAVSFRMQGAVHKVFIDLTVTF